MMNDGLLEAMECSSILCTAAHITNSLCYCIYA